MPKISVIVPVYKAEAYLPSCIDSILSQTFSDFQLILIDDGSPDNCGMICEEYAARDSRISVIHQKNQGQAAARNHALPLAKGEWISFVDSDDLIHPQMLELLHNAVADSGAGISLCELLESPELPTDFTQPRDDCFESLTVDEETLVKLHDMDAYPSWVACAKLIRKELIENHLFCEGRVFEDNEAVCHWVCEAKTIAKIPHPLYFYRTNPDSTTKSTFSMKKLDYLWALERIIKYYTSIGYTRMRERFIIRYLDAAIGFSHGVRNILGKPEVVKEIEKSVIKFLHKEKIRLTKEQRERMLEAMHPKLIRLYWPLAGGIRTIREQGIAGVMEKIRKQLRKGEKE